MSKDTIYREDAIKAINARSNWYQVTCNGKQIAVMLMAKDVNEMLEKVPSADRPQGKWIRDRYWSRGVGMGEEYGFFYKCSMCEYEVESGYTRCGFNYCPYCGADMRGDRRWEMK